MTQSNLLKLAKQGNPKAIAAMLNQSLQPKNITAKVGRKDDCLQILLESAQAVDQPTMVSFIRNGLIKLEVESITTVKVYGRQTGEESPAWSQKFEIVSQPEPPSSTEQTDFNNLLTHQTLHKTPKPVPPTVETEKPSSNEQPDLLNPHRSSAKSNNSSPRPPIGPLSVGNVVSTGLRIYRNHFKLYIGLAFTALLWSFVPIYGWAKNFQIQAIISRQVFQELLNQPESVSTTRTQLTSHLWDFWIAQILIGLICFGVNIGLSMLSAFLIGIPTIILTSIARDNPGLSVILGLLQIVLRLVTFFIYIWVYSRFFIAEVPLAIEDNMTSTNCISRSWELTKGFVSRLQGIILVASLITMPIVLFALTPVWGLIISVSTRASSPETLIYGIMWLIFWFFILITIGSTLMMPFWQAIKAVIYYDLRSRREGLGLQLRDSR